VNSRVHYSGGTGARMILESHVGIPTMAWRSSADPLVYCFTPPRCNGYLAMRQPQLWHWNEFLSPVVNSVFKAKYSPRTLDWPAKGVIHLL
jgi:hypothetical protein